MRKNILIFVSLCATLGVALPTVQAQAGDTQGQSEPQPPQVHIVVEGDTLFSIALQYGTTVEELQQLNNIDDPSTIFVGQEVIIPGIGGARLHTFQVGDSLRGLAAEYGTTVVDIAQVNRLIHPDRLIAGQSLTIVSGPDVSEPEPLRGTAYIVQPDDTMLTVAAQHDLSPAAVAAANDLPFPTYLYPGQRLRLPGEERFQFLSAPWRRVSLEPLSLTQGNTVAITVESLATGQPAGTLGEQPLHFVPYETGYRAFAGLDAFLSPGPYTLELGAVGDSPWAPYVQEVWVNSGNYGTQYVAVPEQLSHLLVPEVRAEEDAFLATIYTQLSERPMWEGPFQLPITNTVVTAGYGDARSYNEGPIEIYHTGIDFLGAVGTPIYAPAAGTVVFSDTLQIRGNTLILDHGVGIMTGYYHLSRILVNEGDSVQRGQLIAEGGSTGLSTGPHLHWDLRVENVPVNGMQWVSDDIAIAGLFNDNAGGEGDAVENLSAEPEPLGGYP